MSKSRKGDKPNDEESDETEAPKNAPWACEVEFFGKPSFMSSVLELTVNNEHVSIVREDGTILAFPYESVSKILIMHTTKKYDLLD